MPLTPPKAEQCRALMVSAAFGGGHLMASAAVAEALEQRLGERLQLAEADVIEMLTPLERTLIVGVYDFWLRYWPQAYQAFYRWTDRKNEPAVITNSFHWLGQAGFRRELLRQRPQLLVSTFPTTTALADTLRRRSGFDFLNALVVTDYRMHHHWARPEADLILLPTQSTHQEMLAWGLPAERLAVTGIPVSPATARLSSLSLSQRREEMCLALNWTSWPDEPVILLSGGSGVYSAFDEVIAELGNLGERVRLLVLAGPRREAAFEQVGGARVYHLGYRHDFPLLLSGADFLVGKAGGMTVAETTALGVPLVIYAPIPGQEEYNAQYLLQAGAAAWPRSRQELRREARLLLDSATRQKMAQASRNIGQPNAAAAAASVLLERLGWED